MSACKDHHGIRHFKASEHEWICSGCGKVDVWRDTWSYFGSMGCKKCHAEPAIEFVACSDECARKWK